MTNRGLLRAVALCLCVLPMAVQAQEKGQWRAVSSTAKSVTGDLAFTDTKIAINFSGFTLAQIRTLEPAEITALFPNSSEANGTGNLFRTDIPGDKHFVHKNTLCGSEQTQWIATFVSGHTLQVAMFSGNAMPKMTAEELANTTSLCGTYSYAR